MFADLTIRFSTRNVRYALSTPSDQKKKMLGKATRGRRKNVCFNYRILEDVRLKCRRLYIKVKEKSLWWNLWVKFPRGEFRSWWLLFNVLVNSDVGIKLEFAYFRWISKVLEICRGIFKWLLVNLNDFQDTFFKDN